MLKNKGHLSLVQNTSEETQGIFLETPWEKEEKMRKIYDDMSEEFMAVMRWEGVFAETLSDMSDRIESDDSNT